jgi:DNA transformation protein and related proteins
MWTKLFARSSPQTALFLKTDEQTEPGFMAAGCGCRMFEEETRGRTVGLHFWSVPASAMDWPAGMEPWARLAVQAALRARTAAPHAKRKTEIWSRCAQASKRPNPSDVVESRLSIYFF